MSPEQQPQGFLSYVTNVGIKDQSKDFVCVYSPTPCTSAAVFTQSLFAGASVVLSREAAKHGALQAIFTISKNSNVATGQVGLDNAQEIITNLSKNLGLASHTILLASTGVIGKTYPMEKIRPALAKVKQHLVPANFIEVAEGIMTTDKTAKYVAEKVGNARLVGVAKGVGMIEPNMATLLVYFFTDAYIGAERLQALFKRVMDKSFNCLSIDSDTSTSDTAAILANGVAGEVDEDAFEQALLRCAIHLVKAVAQDGEGATKLIEVHVNHAKDVEQAKTVAKAIVNSPLVKTAIHGADPNWGRVAMAIGKCHQYTDIDQTQVLIAFDELAVYPTAIVPEKLQQLRAIMEKREIIIRVQLNTGQAHATVWGCDLSPEYVRFNSEYMT